MSLITFVRNTDNSWFPGISTLDQGNPSPQSEIFLARKKILPCHKYSWPGRVQLVTSQDSRLGTGITHYSLTFLTVYSYLPVKVNLYPNSYTDSVQFLSCVRHTLEREEGQLVVKSYYAFVERSERWECWPISLGGRKLSFLILPIWRRRRGHRKWVRQLYGSPGFEYLLGTPTWEIPLLSRSSEEKGVDLNDSDLYVMYVSIDINTLGGIKLPNLYISNSAALVLLFLPYVYPNAGIHSIYRIFYPAFL